SSTTRSTRSGAWTSPSRRRRATTSRGARCSKLSTSRSGNNLPEVQQETRDRMAKTSMVEREKRRAGIVKKYAAKRAQLKEIIRSPRSTPEQRVAAQTKLQQQPRDASASRGRKRCAITGRSRGVYRKFGLSRVKIREVVNRGEIPGVSKASW